MNLNNIGMNEFFSSQVKENEKVGRVAKYAQNHYTLATEDGMLGAIITGKMQYEALLPRIGDFVVYETTKDGSLNVINKLLNRQTCLSRKVAGARSDEQVIASNMDYLFLVMSLNEDFNIRRLERYMIGAWESGAEPVVILTKADLMDDYSEQIQDVESITFGIKCIPISAVTGYNIDELDKYNQLGKTIALVGSSGVGKSTLINTLADKEVMKTDGLRNDDKGHHTTTHREMIFTQGACLIDTPGMREFSTYQGEEGLTHEFQDIIDLSKSCRFDDCTHAGEPDCAIKKALEDGRLEKARYRSYITLEKEISRQERKRKHQEKVQASKIEKLKRKSKPRNKRWNSANY
ncbi:ribosome small subunit-dependent GTPase A [Acidaminobacter sp. JC074]|uniref:ribosome small subunit-dependent GTPase A n=1 Tax=Acidaminobacter sp. JC074 TaxID=2530199 RepID=UPI001F109722|nr:ribosome small subunit-dependent GTPase A [Acidaminobacter sp. JC074]MCH4890551.1 ribosome small subunit-dependent GTPase A [Acidaminobacter sp. JC074]